MAKHWFSWVIVGLMLLVSLIAYPFLPEVVPIHWGIDGQADDFGSKWVNLLLAPSIAALVAILMPILPRIDPRRANYDQFMPTYVAIRYLLLIFFFGLHLTVLAASLGWPIAVATLVQVGVGGLFVGLGNILGRVRPSYFVGIRTPWTLANEEVWRRTHRASGRFMVVIGLLMIVGGLWLPEPLVFSLVMICTVGFVVFSFGYSYIIYRQVAQ